MTDLHLKFKQKLIVSLLIVFIVPPVAFLYYQYLHVLPQKPLPISKKIVEEIIPMVSDEPHYIYPHKIFKIRGTASKIILSKDGKLAFVASASRGIHILSLQNPLEPTLLYHFKYLNNAYDQARDIVLSPDEKTLFVKDSKVGIYTLDVSNPSHPKKLALYPNVKSVNKISLNGDGSRLYLAGSFGLMVADVHNKNKITIIKKINLGQAYYDVLEIQKNILYVLSSSGLEVVDITHINDPIFKEGYPTLGTPLNIILSENRTRAYISSGDSGVEIINIKNIFHPTPFGVFTPVGYTTHTTISKDGKRIFISNLNDDVDIVDVTYPYDAKLLQNIRETHDKGQIWGSVLSPDEKTLYVAYGVLGIGVVPLIKSKQ